MSNRLRARISCAVFALGLFAATGAFAQDVRIQKIRMNKVESPDTWEQVLKTLGTSEFQDVARLIGLPPSAVAKITAVAEILLAKRSQGGETHSGIIASPAGYTLCQAEIQAPSATCDGTFSTSYRRSGPGGGTDGLAFQMTVPRPAGVLPGRCWVDGTVTLVFVKIEKRTNYRCQPYGSCAFSFKGNGTVSRNWPCGVPEIG